MLFAVIRQRIQPMLRSIQWPARILHHSCIRNIVRSRVNNAHWMRWHYIVQFVMIAFCALCRLGWFEILRKIPTVVWMPRLRKLSARHQYRGQEFTLEYSMLQWFLLNNYPWLSIMKLWLCKFEFALWNWSKNVDCKVKFQVTTRRLWIANTWVK